MISHGLAGKCVAIEAADGRAPVRVEIAWEVAGEGLSQAPEALRRDLFGDDGCGGTVRIVAAIDIGEGDSASARLRAEGETGSRRTSVEIACLDECAVTRDASRGLVHIDGVHERAELLITFRAYGQGGALVFARTSVFDLLGIPGGRVEPPTLRASESDNGVADRAWAKA